MDRQCRRCARRAVCRARPGAELPDQADPYPGALCAGRDRRHRLPHRRRQADRGLGPAGGGGEPARRQRLHRDDGGGEGRARRIYAGDGDRRRLRDHAVAVQGRPLQHAARFRADRDGERRAAGARGACGRTLQDGRRGHRRRQGAAGPHLGRHAGKRQRQSDRAGMDGVEYRHQVPAHSLQGWRAGVGLAGRRRHSARRAGELLGRTARQERPRPGAGGGVGQAVAVQSGMADAAEGRRTGGRCLELDRAACAQGHARRR